MTYLSTVLADAPLHYWRVAESGGALAHDIGSAPYHLQGNPTLGAIGYSGIASSGGSARPPDSPQYFIHSSGDLPVIVTPASFECWVWPMGGYGTNTDAIIMDFGNFGLYLGGGGTGFRRPYCYVQDGATGKVAKATADFTLQRWHHLVGTYDEANIRMYVDAILVATTAATAHDTATTIDVCTNNVASRQADVYITECAQYASALSPARINAHFLAQETSSPPVFQLLGTPSLITGAVEPIGTDTAAILAAVKRTFPST